jgi:hypothetical protein
MLTALIALSGCGDDAETSVGQRDTVELRVEILDPGVEPRTTIAYRPDPYRIESIVIVESGRFEGPDGQLIENPAARMRLTVGPVTLLEGGDFRTDIVFRDHGLVDPYSASPEARDVASLSKKIASARGYALRSPGGVLKELSFPALANEPELESVFSTMKTALSRMQAVFPARPVGVGARWRIEMPSRVFDATVSQEMEFVLERFDGTRGALSVRLSQRGENIRRPDSRIMTLSTDGGGTMAFDITSAVSDADVVVRNDLSLEDGDRTRHRRIEFEVRVSREE